MHDSNIFFIAEKVNVNTALVCVLAKIMNDIFFKKTYETFAEQCFFH